MASADQLRRRCRRRAAVRGREVSWFEVEMAEEESRRCGRDIAFPRDGLEIEQGLQGGVTLARGSLVGEPRGRGWSRWGLRRRRAKAVAQAERQQNGCGDGERPKSAPPTEAHGR